MSLTRAGLVSVVRPQFGQCGKPAVRCIRLHRRERSHIRTASVPAAWRRIRNLANRVPGAVVLCYHRVAALEDDPFDLAVTPGEFDRHLQVIHSIGRPSRLNEVVQSTGRGISPTAARRLRRRVVVTFDDGYLDNMEAALPLLERHDIPASLFLASGFIRANREFWWDELAEMVLPAGARSARDFRRLRRLHARLGQVSPDDRRKRLDRLRLRRGVGMAAVPAAAARATHRPMASGEVVRLGKHPLIDVGGHTAWHSMLPALELEERRREIVEGRDQLREMLGRPITAFSYPFGWYDAETIRLVREAGFDSACTIVPAAVRPWTRRFEVPRVMVGRWTAEELERRLVEAMRSG